MRCLFVRYKVSDALPKSLGGDGWNFDAKVVEARLNVLPHGWDILAYA